MLVKNLNGTADNNCICGSWINHWVNFSNQQLANCSVISCTNNASVGGHVKKDNSIVSEWFIIPICQSCNMKKGTALEIYNDLNLVSANRSQTCDKNRGLGKI